jgi:hypothetical protein
MFALLSNMPIDGNGTLFGDRRSTYRAPTLQLDDDLRRDLPDVRAFHAARLGTTQTHLSPMRRDLTRPLKQRGDYVTFKFQPLPRRHRTLDSDDYRDQSVDFLNRRESDLVTSTEKRPSALVSKTSMQSRGGRRYPHDRPRVELLRIGQPRSPIAQRINEQRKCRRKLAPTRVIEMIAGEQQTPVRQHARTRLPSATCASASPGTTSASMARAKGESH